MRDTETNVTNGRVAGLHDDPEQVVRRVRDDYGKIARQRGLSGTPSCCDESRPGSERYGYDAEEIRELPQDADMGLGCGAPVAALEPQPGETILDLGSGGGIDVFLAARFVGPQGRVIGVDMTPDMLDLARGNARKGGYSNVEFREGRLESLPVEDASVDAVTSNCVINLVPDKLAVYREIARVLRPGGRVVVSDIVLDGRLPDALLREMEASNCVVTAIDRQAYLAIVRDAGLGNLEILRDIDYLAAAGWHDVEDMNEDSRALLQRAGVDFEDTRGVVHSVTLRAFKPAS